MKHIKTFEAKRVKKPYVKPEPYFGDYVICKYPEQRYPSGYLTKMQETLPTLIGRVEWYNNNEYGLRYREEDIPGDVKGYFLTHDPENQDLNYVRWCHKKDIIHWSKDRDDLEALFTAKKYNL